MKITIFFYLVILFSKNFLFCAAIDKFEVDDTTAESIYINEKSISNFVKFLYLPVDLQLHIIEKIIKKKWLYSCSKELIGHTEWVLALTNLGNNRIASSSGDNTIRIWDIDIGQTVNILSGHQKSINSIVNLGNNKIASGSEDKTIRIWDIDTGQTLQVLSDHEGYINALINLGDNLIASGSCDKTIRIWNIITGECIFVLNGHDESIWSLINLGDNHIASCSRDKTIRIWNLTTRKSVKILTGHEDWINRIIDLGDNKIASCARDNTIRIWDLTTERSIKILKGHKDWVMSLAKLPNNKIASCSDDKTIRIWDISSGNCECILRGHEKWVRSMITIPDLYTQENIFIASSSNSSSLGNIIKIWQLSYQAEAINKYFNDNKYPLALLICLLDCDLTQDIKAEILNLFDSDRIFKAANKEERLRLWVDSIHEDLRLTVKQKLNID